MGVRELWWEGGQVGQKVGGVGWPAQHSCWEKDGGGSASMFPRKEEDKP